MGPQEWIAFGGLVFLIASGGTGVIWKLASTKSEIVDRLIRSKDGTTRDMDELRREVEAVERRGAEPFHAMREKLTQVELYIRDQYVSKREYERDYAHLLLAIKNMQESIEKRLESYEERVEKALMGRLPLG